MTQRPTTSSSNIHRRKSCPGSHHAEHGLPEETSEEAAEGTLLHARARDRDGMHADLDPEQFETLERLWEIYCQVLATIVHSEELLGEMYVEGGEKELWLHERLRPVLCGHCDYWRYYPERKVLIILDWKFGRIPVDEAATNLQLRAYATQADQEWRCERVYVGIIQPRVFGPAARSVACYTRPALDAARREMFAILADCEPLNAPRHASDAACQYCKAKVNCDEYRRPMLEIVPAAHIPLADLAPDQLATFYVACQFAAKIADDVKAEMRTRIRAGELPGWTLTENAPRRAIKDAVAAFEQLRLSGFTEAEIMAVAGLTVGNAQKLYTNKGRTAKEAKQAVNTVLADVIQTTEPEMSIERL